MFNVGCRIVSGKESTRTAERARAGVVLVAVILAWALSLGGVPFVECAMLWR